MAHAIPKSLEIPLHCIAPSEKDNFYRRTDFFTFYDKSDPDEIGVLIDPDTSKPICRVVCVLNDLPGS